MSQTIVGNLAVELGMSTEEFQRALAHAQVQAQAAANKIQNQVNSAGKSASSGVNPQGLLAVSRAIDDVQYGFRGVINNIESIVTGLGGSAGVAGAATIAAVAISAIAPKIAALVSAVDPITQLSLSLKEIQMSGAAGTFVGIAEQAKATQAAFEAASEVLKGMQTQQFTISPFAGGPGMGAAPQAGLTGEDPVAVFAQRVATNQLAQDAARQAFEANRARSRIAAGGLAGFELTTDQQDQTKLNQKLFQAAVDKLGGGQNLADALKIKNLGNPALFGSFKEGDLKATDEAVRLLGLQAEQAKIMADEFERATGAAAELAKIENDSIRQQKRIDNRQFEEYQRAVFDQDKLIKRRDAIDMTLNRSEIVGASDVFARNLNAGQEDPQLKELKEIKEEIKNLGSVTGILN